MGDLEDRTLAEVGRRLEDMGLPGLRQLLADGDHEGRIKEILRGTTHHQDAADRVMELLRELGLL